MTHKEIKCQTEGNPPPGRNAPGNNHGAKPNTIKKETRVEARMTLAQREA
jgi:hypothetical protein